MMHGESEISRQEYERKQVASFGNLLDIKLVTFLGFTKCVSEIPCKELTGKFIDLWLFDPQKKHLPLELDKLFTPLELKPFRRYELEGFSSFLKLLSTQEREAICESKDAFQKNMPQLPEADLQALSRVYKISESGLKCSGKEFAVHPTIQVGNKQYVYKWNVDKYTVEQFAHDEEKSRYGRLIIECVLPINSKGKISCQVQRHEVDPIIIAEHDIIKNSVDNFMYMERFLHQGSLIYRQEKCNDIPSNQDAEQIKNLFGNSAYKTHAFLLRLPSGKPRYIVVGDVNAIVEGDGKPIIQNIHNVGIDPRTGEVVIYDGDIVFIDKHERNPQEHAFWESRNILECRPESLQVADTVIKMRKTMEAKIEDLKQEGYASKVKNRITIPTSPQINTPHFKQQNI